MLERDEQGELQYPDFCDDSPEGVAAFNELAALSIEHDLGCYIDKDGESVTEPQFDAEGRALWRLTLPAQPAPVAAQTIGDRHGPPRDAMDEALASLPMTANKRTRVAVLLMANCTGAAIRAKLHVSDSTISMARAALLREHDERLARGERPDALPEAVTNAVGLANRGQPRPDMRLGSGTSPMEKRANDLGVSVADAQMLAADQGRITKFGERPKDVKAAAKAREYRERKRRERETVRGDTDEDTNGE